DCAWSTVSSRSCTSRRHRSSSPLRSSSPKLVFPRFFELRERPRSTGPAPGRENLGAVRLPGLMQFTKTSAQHEAGELKNFKRPAAVVARFKEPSHLW